MKLPLNKQINKRYFIARQWVIFIPFPRSARKKNNDILTVILFMVISLQTVRLIGDLSIYWKTGRVIDKMSDYFLLLMYFFSIVYGCIVFTSSRTKHYACISDRIKYQWVHDGHTVHCTWCCFYTAEVWLALSSPGCDVNTTAMFLINAMFVNTG